MPKGVKVEIDYDMIYYSKYDGPYKIIEDSLNLRDVRIFDYVEDENGNKKPVLNKKETILAVALLTSSLLISSVSELAPMIAFKILLESKSTTSPDLFVTVIFIQSPPL